MTNSDKHRCNAYGLSLTFFGGFWSETGRDFCLGEVPQTPEVVGAGTPEGATFAAEGTFDAGVEERPGRDARR